MRVPGLVYLLPFVFAAVVPAQASAQDGYGTRVASIAIEGASATVLEDLPISVGSTLTRSLLRDAIQVLYDREEYGRIEVGAGQAPEGGTDLTFYVEEPYFFATVRIEPRDLLERSLSSYTTLPYGERFSRTRLDGIVEEVVGLLEAEGYFGVGVDPVYTRDVNTRLVSSVIRVAAGLPARIGEVRFEGGEQTFSEAELADAMDLHPGDRFRLEDVRLGEERLRALFAGIEGRAGFLETNIETRRTWDPGSNRVDVTVGVDPGNYTFVDLRGFPLSDERLRELVPIFEEGSYDPDLVEEGRLNLLEYLQRDGYFEAEVTTPSTPIEVALDPTGPDDAVAVQVIYEVTRGQRYVVAAVDIEGNSYFEDGGIRDEIGVVRRGVFSRGVFSSELMRDAEQTILAMYTAAGFSGTEVVATRVIERNEISVTIQIDEGEQVEVGQIDVTGNQALTRDEVIRAGNIREAGTYRPLDLESARRAIVARYHGLGYADVNVVATDDLDAEFARITYAIEEGERYDIGRIVVAGQTRTRPGVIGRYAREHIREMAPYDPEAIEETQRSLYGAGIFSRVDVVSLEQNRGGRRDVLIQVEDASPLLLTYGAGIQEGLDLQGTGGSRGDSVDVRGTIELSHNNLWGLDRTISARVQGSRREQRFQTTYREPQLFNWDLEGFASFLVERLEATQYAATTVDFLLQTLYEFPNDDNLLLTASFKTVNLSDIRVTLRPTDETGTIQVATIGGSWVRDTRNDPFNPSRGNYLSTSLRVGYQGYGSDVDFTSLFAQASLFRPIRQTVLAASVRFGWNQPFGETTELPITERYFAGGSTTLRAFDVDEAGREGGGNALYLFNLEYRFPIPFLPSELSGAVFYDTGTVFQRISDFRFGAFTHTAGFGLRYLTPVGPVRVDFGLNLNQQTQLGERPHKFHFTLGHAF